METLVQPRERERERQPSVLLDRSIRVRLQQHSTCHMHLLSVWLHWLFSSASILIFRVITAIATTEATSG